VSQSPSTRACYVIESIVPERIGETQRIRCSPHSRATRANSRSRVGCCDAGARHGAVDVQAVARRHPVRPDPGGGVPFLLAFCNERDGTLFETPPLARSAPSPRVESRGDDPRRLAEVERG